MPMSAYTRRATGNQYGAPFVGEAEYPVQIPIVVANFTTFEIDGDGYMKPGVVLSSTGALITTAIPAYIVIPEAIRVAKSNVSGDLTAAGTVDIAGIANGMVNRYIIENNLGRALTAAEIASFNIAGSQLKLLA